MISLAVYLSELERAVGRGLGKGWYGGSHAEELLWGRGAPIRTEHGSLPEVACFTSLGPWQSALGEWVTGELGAPELEGAVLPVEGEVGDGDGARRAKDGGRQPVHFAPRIDQHVAGVGNLEGAVIAGGQGQGPQ